MPDEFGFNHLPNRGELLLRCIWCPHTARPGTPDEVLARHQRKHRKDVLEAQEASKREFLIARDAIVV